MSQKNLLYTHKESEFSLSESADCESMNISEIKNYYNRKLFKDLRCLLGLRD